MTLAEEADNKIKRYEGLNDDDSSAMQVPMVNPQQANYINSTLLTAKSTTLSKTITANTLITAEIWQTLIEHLNKANQENKLLKKACKKKAQQNQMLVAEAAWAKLGKNN